LTGLESLYTPQKVYTVLARELDIAAGAEVAHYDRYSVQDDGGIESQVARHCALYPTDPDVAAYRALPASAFDSPAAGAAHGIRWLSLADIHHSLTDRRPVVAFVMIGKTVFFQVELSAVERQIERPDSEYDNAFTALVLAVTNHLRNLRVSRWADDVTRAARENVNWGRIMRRHHERGIRMCLGGVVHNLAKKGTGPTSSCSERSAPKTTANGARSSWRPADGHAGRRSGARRGPDALRLEPGQGPPGPSAPRQCKGARPGRGSRRCSRAG
jgi:hypothetical protein